MAERRMFAKTVILSDDFLDMSASARCLYFCLGVVADDDGFVNNPKSIMRQCCASSEDLQELIDAGFIIRFDSGVIVIVHWLLNNYIRNDRYTPTKCVEEKERIDLDENDVYLLTD